VNLLLVCYNVVGNAFIDVVKRFIASLSLVEHDFKLTDSLGKEVDCLLLIRLNYPFFMLLDEVLLK